MSSHQAPIERIFDLSDLSEAGYETIIRASADDLASIAAWEGVVEVTRFEARITLRRLSPTRFDYGAELDADIVQSCVVTLEPVRTHISRTFSRTLHLSPARFADRAGPLTLAAADDEAPEEIESLKFDLAGPVLEEFSLAVDPYPRAPGVTFEPPRDEAGKEESPFAVLKRLKQG